MLKFLVNDSQIIILAIAYVDNFLKMELHDFDLC